MPEAVEECLKAEEPVVSWVDYRIMKQYRPMGEILDNMRLYGYRGGIEEMLTRSWDPNEGILNDLMDFDITKNKNG